MVEALRRGLETGEVMEDEVARRRESVPPPSVSRVMQRLGMEPEGVLPSATLSGAGAPVAATPARAAEPAAPALPARRGTGTPRVGVPIVTAQAASAPQPEVSGMIEPPALVPRARRASSQALDPSNDPNNISQAWYDEGDLGSDDAGSARARKLSSPSMSDLALYDDELPPRSRRGLIIGVVALLAVGGLVAFALTRGGGEPTPAPAAQPIAMAGAPVDAAPSTIMTDPVDAGVAPVPEPAPVTTIKTSRTPPSKTSPSTGSRGTSSTSNRPVSTSSSSLVPGSDPMFRPPGTNPSPRTNTPAVTPTHTVITPVPTPTGPTGPTGVSGVDGPLDPYGTGGPTEPSPGDGSSGEQKAVFFANLGTQQLGSGDTASAAASFKKALELDARNVAATIGMGEIALRQGLFGDAIAHLRKAARNAPRSARVFTLLGEAYLNSGNHGEAANNFKKALQLEPDNARARDGYNEASSRVPPPSDD